MVTERRDSKPEVERHRPEAAAVTLMPSPADLAIEAASDPVVRTEDALHGRRRRHVWTQATGSSAGDSSETITRLPSTSRLNISI